MKFSIILSFASLLASANPVSADGSTGQNSTSVDENSFYRTNTFLWSKDHCKGNRDKFQPNVKHSGCIVIPDAKSISANEVFPRAKCHLLVWHNGGCHGHPNEDIKLKEGPYYKLAPSRQLLNYFSQ